MGDLFKNSFYCSKAPHTLFYKENCEQLLAAGKKLPFKPDTVTYRSFSEAYGRGRGWCGRKVKAAFAFSLTTPLKILYHLAISILSTLSFSRNKIKVHVFTLIRDLEEWAGNLISLFHERLGRYLIEEALHQKRCYKIIQNMALVTWYRNERKVRDKLGITEKLTEAPGERTARDEAKVEEPKKEEAPQAAEAAKEPPPRRTSSPYPSVNNSRDYDALSLSQMNSLNYDMLSTTDILRIFPLTTPSLAKSRLEALNSENFNTVVRKFPLQSYSLIPTSRLEWVPYLEISKEHIPYLFPENEATERFKKISDNYFMKLQLKIRAASPNYFCLFPNEKLMCVDFYCINHIELLYLFLKKKRQFIISDPAYINERLQHISPRQRQIIFGDYEPISEFLKTEYGLNPTNVNFLTDHMKKIQAQLSLTQPRLRPQPASVTRPPSLSQINTVDYSRLTSADLLVYFPLDEATGRFKKLSEDNFKIVFPKLAQHSPISYCSHVPDEKLKCIDFEELNARQILELFIRVEGVQINTNLEYTKERLKHIPEIFYVTLNGKIEGETPESLQRKYTLTQVDFYTSLLRNVNDALFKTRPFLKPKICALLGKDPTISDNDLRKAYHRFSQSHHPDKVHKKEGESVEGFEKRKNESDEQFKEVSSLYSEYTA